MTTRIWSANRSFLTTWILTTTAACILAMPIGIILAHFPGGGVTAWLMIGAMIGYAQRLALRGRLDVGPWWIGASVLGLATWGFAEFALQAALSYSDSSNGLTRPPAEMLALAFLPAAIAGGVSGLLQTTELRKSGIGNRRWLWPVACAVAVGFAWLLVGHNAFLGAVKPQLDAVWEAHPAWAGFLTVVTGMVGGAGGPLLYSVTTGTALNWVAPPSNRH